MVTTFRDYRYFFSGQKFLALYDEVTQTPTWPIRSTTTRSTVSASDIHVLDSCLSKLCRSFLISTLYRTCSWTRSSIARGNIFFVFSWIYLLSMALVLINHILKSIFLCSLSHITTHLSSLAFRKKKSSVWLFCFSICHLLAPVAQPSWNYCILPWHFFLPPIFITI